MYFYPRFFTQKAQFIVVFVLLLSLSGCKNNKHQEGVSKPFLKVTDYYGRNIILQHEPKRIISVSPGITEIIFALGQGQKQIARSEFCLYPKEACSLPKIGGLTDANIEKIISLNPDLVIVSSIFTKHFVETLERVGVPVIAFPEKDRFSGIFQTLTLMGQILNAKEKADSITLSINKQLSYIKELTKNENKKPTVYYVIGYGQAGDFTAGGNTFINDMINLAGGKNIAENSSNWTYSREKLFEQNPDYIFIRNDDLSDFCKTFPYKNLTAVKNGRVFGIESIMIDVQGIHSIDGVQFMAERLQGKY